MAPKSLKQHLLDDLRHFRRASDREAREFTLWLLRSIEKSEKIAGKEAA